MSSRVLVHLCCGPCALVPLARLKAEGYEPVGLFYNPNIHGAAEYLRRRESTLQAAAHLGVKVILKDDEYDPQAYFRQVSFREDNRCFHCYHLRLERTAQIARRGGFAHFTTSLLYSKRQKHDVITGLGRDLAQGGASGRKADFLYRDFRDGWGEGIEQSKELGLYRQDYCGCLYSEVERRSRDIRDAGT